MDLYDKIQTGVLTSAVFLVGASIYMITNGATDLKQYSMPLALSGCLLGVSTIWLGYFFSRLREKKLYQNIGNAIGKFADQIDNHNKKSK